ncbi:hypothetical protein Gohar_014963, partial [Gossypium harknessii]|nr:hypothetical protein [Gossypium harknessii]
MVQVLFLTKLNSFLDCAMLESPFPLILLLTA